MQAAPLPKVDKGRVRWWRSRLEQYRSPVLFTWNALTFHESNLLPGIAVWSGMHITVIVLLGMSSSIIQTTGQVLVILALLYALLQIGPKVSEIELFPKWVPAFDSRFQSICVRIAHAEQLLRKVVTAAMQMRESKPWKFYCIGVVVSILLIELGRWFSTTLFIQIIVVVMLSLPPALEYDLISEDSMKQLKHLLTEIYVKLKHKLEEYHARHQRNR